MEQIKINMMDFFMMGPAKRNNTLYPFIENRDACFKKCRQLRRDEFLNTLAVSRIGRGQDIKVVVDDIPRFEAIEAEIKILETRASDIDKMLTVLESIVIKVGNIEIDSPTPDGVLHGVGQRRKEIANIRSFLAKQASLYLGVDTVANPLTTPQEVATFMKKDLDEADRRIAKMEEEIEILEALSRDCKQVMAENSHLLIPAEEPEVEPEQKI